ncbi:DUF6639 family protein [Tropicimonas sediminicola]|uniref:Peptidase MA superfamily protein n=1 Tax=Tropicimonas sediminicola TaxID=1031541 RepID=A0A239HKQ3_9RHOB|nr:DUF6639 family protein [Tropicimonas sediminicola]SNS81930.1 hypothetical protein SAMN05421757_103472 [Tropicimonas sediminicola]
MTRSIVRPRRGAVSVAAIALALALPAHAEPAPCPDPLLRIDAPPGSDISRLCEVATAARDDARVCGIDQRKPLDIVLKDEVDFAAGHALAAFDCRNNSINILPPELMAASISENDGYAGLSTERLFRSVLTHEMAHALLHQTLDGCPVASVDHEYVANALELAAMPPLDRERLLEAVDLHWEVTPEMISLSVYMLAPRRFAVTAWLHYESHGCEAIEGILDGSYSFRAPR